MFLLCLPFKKPTLNKENDANKLYSMLCAFFSIIFVVLLLSILDDFCNVTMYKFYAKVNKSALFIEFAICHSVQ